VPVGSLFAFFGMVCTYYTIPMIVFLGPQINIPSVSHWFFKRRGLALGVATSSSAIGGVIWPIAIDHLIIKVEHLSLELRASLIHVSIRWALVGPFASAASSA